MPETRSAPTPDLCSNLGDRTSWYRPPNMGAGGATRATLASIGRW
jgi:hypothetical protein